MLIEKRKKAKKLKAKGWSNRKIARYLVASKDSIRKWINMNDEELDLDNRGWKKGNLRKNTKEAKERIKTIRKDLVKEESFLSEPMSLKEIMKSNIENKSRQCATEYFGQTRNR